MIANILEDVKSGKRDALVAIACAKIYIDNLEFTIKDTLLYSFRYALGKSTYCVQDVCIAISKHKDILDASTINIIKKEIQSYLYSAPIGFTQEWKDLYKELSNDPKGYSMSTLEVPKDKCTYKGNGFVCDNGYDTEDSRLICPKCHGTGYKIKETN